MNTRGSEAEPVEPARETSVERCRVGLERDVFLRTLLRHLAGTLEDVVGTEEAAGFISVVGQQMGEDIGDAYRMGLGVERLSREQVAEVLVDLKRRIKGEFSVVDQDDERILMVNRACPFGDKVLGRPTLCMMTSNVFGSIASRELGYAKVELQQTIARGDGQCTVLVHLKSTKEAKAAPGREYYRGAEYE
ncbi:MAG: transcriptional regulator [Myxococcales bacterium]|nr:transcriptional regulator [Myxococcales bacterium]